ncbi:MAG: 4-(cytidine 5'-diphospho)-2-C-methyl-D-erythritol kinase [Ginsengibacter sp.]
MIIFPNCKINLGLNILSKRKDGFHDLETIFFPVDLHDALEIIPAQNKTELLVTGISTGNTADNLCLKAFYLLKKDYPQLPEIKMHLHKTIPLGAGLGGGSADAAFALHLLNKKFNLTIPEKRMFGYALQLGSDCPFFLFNKPCLATGRGEILEEVNISLSAYKILLIYPGIHISTAEAFGHIQPAFPAQKIKEIIQQPVENWKEALHNDFEKYVFEKSPGIKKIKQDLYKAGAVYAAMSGSGSTVYGIFKKDAKIKYVSNPAYFHKLLEIPGSGNGF